MPTVPPPPPPPRKLTAPPQASIRAPAPEGPASPSKLKAARGSVEASEGDEVTRVAHGVGPRPVVVLCVTGSIAAYKAAEIARGLLQAGVKVVPVMTRSAEEFLGAATLSGLTGEPVKRDMWDPSFPGEMHVALARQADLVLVAPATADLLARMSQGRADDLVTALALVSERPLLVAPAMHPSMWAHPATQRNVAQLSGDGRVEWLGPVDGQVASGDEGMGRMMAPQSIVEAVLSRLTPKDLSGLRLVVTAGPTIEDLDPVRFLSNRSSGKMGFSIAKRAAARGAQVTLVSGPTDLPTPHKVRRVDVRSAVAMRGAVWQALGPDLSMADALVMSAAVSDYRPAEIHASKQKKTGDKGSVSIELVLNPDILAEIGHARQSRSPYLVGFAVETDTDEKIIAYAQGKLSSKRVDLVVANRASDSFGRNDNRAMFVTAERVEHQGTLAKDALADRLLDHIQARVAGAR